MTVKIKCSGLQLTEERLREYSAKSGLLLPEDYRAFLLRWNGGKAAANRFLVSSEQGETSVHFFFGVSEETWADLGVAYESYAGRLPRSLLPIATDDCGNPICLSMWGQDKNGVYFVDHEREDEFPANVYKLAASFTEFFNDVLQPDRESAAATRDELQ